MNISADSTGTKLVLLFVLEKIEIPLSENSILDICCSRNNWINYMECKEILFQLIEANFIYTVDDKSDEQRYNITVEGQNCLSHFYRRIPLALRDEITEFTKQNRLAFKRSQEYVSDYEKAEDGSYKLFLKIRSPFTSDPMFKLEFRVPSRETAINTCKAWRDKAPLIYESVYENLIEEE
ncbi:MAG: DUF4364 family protein [Clostridia bacterium]|nr:DUF4364 family protein [Clostridia bacterium]